MEFTGKADVIKNLLIVELPTNIDIIMTSKIGKGFRWAKREHIWERRTNGVIIVSIGICFSAYYFDIYPSEIALLFLLLICFFHGIARFCHKMEQHYLKHLRHPKQNQK